MMTQAQKTAEARPATLPLKRSWRVNFRHKDTADKPRPHSWLPAVIVIDGCATVEEVREKLRELVNAAVFQIEPERTS